MDKTRTIVLLLLFAMIVLAPHARAQGIIIPIPPNPPPSPQPPPTLREVVVVDDDGLDCPNADVIGERALNEALRIVVDNGTIIACSGVYRGFTNAIRGRGFTVSFKPVVVKGNGTVKIYVDRVGDVIFENVEIVVKGSARFSSTYVRIYGSRVILEPSECTLGQISLRVSSSEVLFVNTTITAVDSSDRPVIAGEPDVIVFNNTYIDVAVDVRSDYVVIMNSTKTSKGSQPYLGMIMDPQCGIWIQKAEPSIDVRSKSIVIEHSVISGTAYLIGDKLVLKHNLIEPHGYNALPGLRLWTGLDGVVVNVSEYIVEYNVFKNHLPEPLSNSDELWGAIRVISGSGIIKRNLFYGNNVALIVGEGSSPTVYDNVFIGNRIHMASIQYTEIASIDPPRPGPNVIGGPFLGGNYWDDYVGPDYDGDGLGDIPYVNDYNVIDIHPLTPWGLVKCPPYMGGYKLATSNTLYQLLSMRSLILSATLTLGVTITSTRRRFKGLMGIIGITTVLAITIAIVVLVFQLSYNINTSILAKPLSPLAPLGTPLVADNRLYLTLYNPGSAPVCVKYAILNSSKTILYPMQREYLVDLATSLEDQILRGDVNYTLILEKLVNALIIEPKDSKEFTAYVEGVRGIADLSIVTNNGVWRMHVFGKG